MNKLIRKESQVAKDFNESLRKAVKYVRNEADENKELIANLKSQNSVCLLSSSNDAKTCRETANDSILTNNPDVSTRFLKTCELQSQSEKSQFEKEDNHESFQKLNLKSNEKKQKKPILQNMLSINEDIPFESTAIDDLRYLLPIIIMNEEKLNITVYNHFTVDVVKSKISKKKSLPKEEIALYYTNTRLEGHVTLSWYNVTRSSRLDMKILKKTEYFGIYMDQSYPIYLFTSEKTMDIKNIFSKLIKENPEFIELKYKEIFLHNNKEFFKYDIPPGSTIQISKRRSSLSPGGPGEVFYEKSPGYEVCQTFGKITADLKKCNCYNIRMDALACAYLSLFDENFKGHECLDLLEQFESNYHLNSCQKSRSNSVGQDAVDIPQFTSSIDETTLTESINAEIENQKVAIEETDLEYLYYAKNFKTFKRFLREKIGTKCDLKSVAMLYYYAKCLAQYITSKEKNYESTDRILKFIKQYFTKYFEKKIIAKGGLITLIPRHSD